MEIERQNRKEKGHMDGLIKQIVGADKTLTIKDANDEELSKIYRRLQLENDVQRSIKELRRNSKDRGTLDPYDVGEGVDLNTPIKDLYHEDNLDNALKHYGIMGMKWGVRRYQNPDGTLTEAGLKRRAKRDNKAAAKSQKTAVKNRKSLTEAELDNRIARLEKEKKLKQLVGEEVTPGKTWVNNIMSNAGNRALTTIATGAVLYITKASLEKKFDAKEAADYVAPKPKK